MHISFRCKIAYSRQKPRKEMVMRKADTRKKDLWLHLANIVESSSRFRSLFHDFEYVLKFRIGGGAQKFK